MKVELTSPQEVFDTFQLKEHSVYAVKVKGTYNNPEHEAILFTGFRNGNYCCVFNNTYDAPIPMMNLYSMKIVKYLYSLK